VYLDSLVYPVNRGSAVEAERPEHLEPPGSLECLASAEFLGLLELRASRESVDLVVLLELQAHPALQDLAASQELNF
jgi:hypothetical protein